MTRSHGRGANAWSRAREVERRGVLQRRPQATHGGARGGKGDMISSMSLDMFEVENKRN